jgi:MIP family channel proteins
MGIAMAGTAIGIIYSPFGKLSGAHMNPAVTLTFLWLRKIRTKDAAFYVLFQFTGALLGAVLAKYLLGSAFTNEPVRSVATLPGRYGTLGAFVSEAIISLVLMYTVLWFSGSRGKERFTGVAAGLLVMLFITFEAPFSGMSMNPARSLASAASFGSWNALWVYFTAPIIGMMLGATLFQSLNGRFRVRCAKLCHSTSYRCLFCNAVPENQLGRVGDIYRNSSVLRHRVCRSVNCPWCAQVVSYRRSAPVVTRGIAALAATLALVAGVAAARAEDSVVEVVRVRMNVGEMSRAVAFYRDVLQFETVKSGESSVLRLGAETLELRVESRECDRPLPSGGRSNDLWFQHIAIVVSDMDRAYELLKRNRVVHISDEPQTLPAWNKAAGGIRAFYFRDPDGHNLELIFFPPGKGDPRWQLNSGKLFLGIDHTAIVVSDTRRSLRYYRDELGLGVQGNSENWGIEQERLNNVRGAHLQITGLRAKAGIGVEFLKYLYPLTGRVTPPGSCSSNITTVMRRKSSTNGSSTDPDGHRISFE